MKYTEQYEQLLKQALSPEAMPDEKLNEQIRKLSKEDYAMKKTSKKKAVFIPLVSMLVLLMSIGVFAAWNLMKPEKVAEEIEDAALAKAFESEDAIRINETQIDGGYKITLLGLVSGKGISDFAGDKLEKDRTYAVLAIANEDGSPMPDTSDDEYGKVSFFASPLVKGIKPWQFNIYFMEGGYTEFVKDGIQYRMIACDSIEMFADRGLELCVIGNSFTYNIEAFTYNEQTGEITPNEDYEGTNVVFDLPIDVKKANPEAAEKYLQEILTEDETSSEEMSEKEREAERLAEEAAKEVLEKEQEEINRLIDQGTEIPGSFQELKVDEKGYVHYEFYSDEYGGTVGDYLLENLFPDENVNIRNESYAISEDEAGNETRIAIQFRRDENGVITARIIAF